MSQGSGISTFGGTISGGIQDTAALLPLLGTEQFEKHVGSALNNGFLYAAATPLSLFGSLGAVRAALTICCASIRYRRFFGAKVLKDAGFSTVGGVAALIALDGERYLAESRLELLLREQHINNPDVVEIDFETSQHSFLGWNTLLLLSSIFFAALGTIPYLRFLIRGDTSNILLAWLFPLIRVMGVVLCAIPSQFILQNRLSLILNQRMKFLSIDKKLSSGIKDKLRASDRKWGSQFTSEECLLELYHYFLGHDLENQTANHSTLAPEAGAADESYRTELQEFFSKHYRCAFSLLPSVTWIVLMTIGSAATIVGYVGCFSLIQDMKASTTSKYLWVGLEVFLALARLGIWASNPTFDNSPGFCLMLKLSNNQLFLTTNQDSSIIDDKVPFSVIEEQQFLERLTEYSGPAERLKIDNTFVYYALTGRSATSKKLLYIALYDAKKRAAFLYCPHGSSEQGIFHASLVPDPVTSDMRVQRQEKVPESHRFVQDQPFKEALDSHHKSIFEMVTESDGHRKGRKANKMLVDWMLKRKEQQLGDVDPRPEGSGSDPAALKPTENIYLHLGRAARLKYQIVEEHERWLQAYINHIQVETIRDFCVFDMPKEAAPDSDLLRWLRFSVHAVLEWFIVGASVDLEQMLLEQHSALVDLVKFGENGEIEKRLNVEWDLGSQHRTKSEQQLIDARFRTPDGLKLGTFSNWQNVLRNLYENPLEVRREIPKECLREYCWLYEKTLRTKMTFAEQWDERFWQWVLDEGQEISQHFEPVRNMLTGVEQSLSKLKTNDRSSVELRTDDQSRKGQYYSAPSITHSKFVELCLPESTDQLSRDVSALGRNRIMSSLSIEFGPQNLNEYALQKVIRKAVSRESQGKSCCAILLKYGDGMYSEGLHHKVKRAVQHSKISWICPSTLHEYTKLQELWDLAIKQEYSPVPSIISTRFKGFDIRGDCLMQDNTVAASLTLGIHFEKDKKLCLLIVHSGSASGNVLVHVKAQGFQNTVKPTEGFQRDTIHIGSSSRTGNYFVTLTPCIGCQWRLFSFRVMQLDLHTKIEGESKEGGGNGTPIDLSIVSEVIQTTTQRPFPKRPDSAAKVEEVWKYLRIAVEHSLRGNLKPASGVVSIEGLYTTVYKYVTESRQKNRKAALDRKLTECFALHVKSILEEASRLRGPELLVFYATEWKLYLHGTMEVCTFFKGMSEEWIGIDIREDTYLVFDLALLQWKKLILQRDNQMVELTERLLDALKRPGAGFDKSSVQGAPTVILSFIFLDCAPPFVGSNLSGERFRPVVDYLDKQFDFKKYWVLIHPLLSPLDYLLRYDPSGLIPLTKAFKDYIAREGRRMIYGLGSHDVDPKAYIDTLLGTFSQFSLIVDNMKAEVSPTTSIWSRMFHQSLDMACGELINCNNVATTSYESAELIVKYIDVMRTNGEVIPDARRLGLADLFKYLDVSGKAVFKTSYKSKLLDRGIPWRQSEERTLITTLFPGNEDSYVKELIDILTAPRSGSERL